MSSSDRNSDVTDNDAASASRRASTSTSTVTVNPRKRRGTGSFHATTHARRLRRRSGGESMASPSPVGNGWADVKAIGGAWPPLNCQSAVVEDPANNRFFVVGGLRPDEKMNIPSSDLWCCDTTTMTWTNLTNALTFSDKQFSQAALYPVKTALPQLTLPGCCIFQINGRGLIFLIGGYNAELDQPSARVIVVDPDLLLWYYLDVEGNPVGSRTHPVVTSVGNDIYVFGGYAYLRPDGVEEKDHNCRPYHSFSILTFNPDNGTWRWTVRDRPYTNPGQQMGVPQGHAFGAAIPVYGGKKILLLPGRHTEDDPISFTSTNIFYYHLANEKFQPATPNYDGDFPQNLGWHCSFEYLKPAAATPAVNNGLNGVTYSSPASPVVIIGGWRKVQGGPNELVPELWKLFLSPEDRICCLKYSQHVGDLEDYNFALLVWAEGRLRLVGNKHDQNQGGGIPRMDAYIDLPDSE